MRKPLTQGLVGLLFLLGTSDLLAKYKIKEIQVKSAREYAAHQDFQNIVIAAYPCETEARTLELFDTKKLYEKQIMPVLVVVENNNDFAIRILEQDILLLNAEGTPARSLPYTEVLIRIELEEGKAASTRPEVLLQQGVDREMLEDFEHKAFGEKLIAPRSSESGVIFFRLPENGDLAGNLLYIPEIFNIADRESLMFFEFELGMK